MNIADIVPNGNNLLILQVKSEEKTSSGIILSGGVGNETPHGKVIASSLNRQQEFPLGAIIFVNWEKAHKILVDSRPYYFIDTEHVLGKVV